MVLRIGPGCRVGRFSRAGIEPWTSEVYIVCSLSTHGSDNSAPYKNRAATRLKIVGKSKAQLLQVVFHLNALAPFITKNKYWTRIFEFIFFQISQSFQISLSPNLTLFLNLYFSLSRCRSRSNFILYHFPNSF